MPRRPVTTTSLPVPAAPMVVVGDIMCDHYVWGDVERISPEAPVQVLRWEREADRPGGAANAAMNLAALGCRVHLVGVVGKDAPGHWLMRTLRASGIDTSGIVESPDRATTLKTRVIARGQHMLRIDRETRVAVSARDERHMIAVIKRLRGKTACILCSDYNKGVLSDAVLAATLGDSRRPLCVVDPKGRDFSRYRGAHLLTPNEKELMEAAADADPRIHGDELVSRRAEALMRRMKFPALLVTRGGNGMDLFEAEGRTIRRAHIPALQRHDVFDVTGAGDTVAAVVAMGRSAGMTLADAARLANAAAGIVVGMVGTAVTDAGMLARVMNGDATQAGSKVLPRKVLAARLGDARAHGAAVVFTSGPFDSFNVKDLQRLQRARAQGDVLVVGVSDDSPAGSQRAEMLAALRFVDFVTLFSERTAARVIRELRPDVII